MIAHLDSDGHPPPCHACHAPPCVCACVCVCVCTCVCVQCSALQKDSTELACTPRPTLPCCGVGAWWWAPPFAPTPTATPLLLLHPCAVSLYCTPTASMCRPLLLLLSFTSYHGYHPCTVSLCCILALHPCTASFTSMSSAGPTTPLPAGPTALQSSQGGV